MSFDFEDTIAAVASAPGGSLRGIVRISGPDVLVCVGRVFQRDNGVPLESVRRATVFSGRLSVGSLIGDLPCDLYLWPNGRSFTGQPAAELHMIGSPPILDAALRSLCEAGARLARPGEFTMRAFLAGRLDLTQAEAVLGVIDARGRRELNVALAQLAGGLSSPLHELRETLLNLLAHLEAGLDFVDEDIEFITADELCALLDAAAVQVSNIADRMARRGVACAERRVVLVGWPNVGKSSLLNALAGREAAIVSPVAGTTRDYVTCRVSMGGVDCLLADTAGVQSIESHDAVGVSAQLVTAEQTERAQLQLFCLDSTRPLNEWERRRLGERVEVPRIVVLTKSDLLRATDYAGSAVQTSSKNGDGLDSLRRAIVDALHATDDSESAVVTATAVRCEASLRLAAAGLGRARQLAEQRSGEELVAAEIRAVLDEIGQVVGAVYTDDVLDRIFSRFCIGK